MKLEDSEVEDEVTLEEVCFGFGCLRMLGDCPNSGVSGTVTAVTIGLAVGAGMMGMTGVTGVAGVTGVRGVRREAGITSPAVLSRALLRRRPLADGVT